MGTRFLIIFIFIVGSFRSVGQINALSNEQSQQLLRLARQLFELSPRFEYSLSYYYTKQEYREIKDAEIYDSYFLANYLDSLKSDPHNPLFNYWVGMFYQKNNYPKTAIMCFQKAIEALDIRYFDMDSAKYYSFRGLLKSQLADQDAFTDLEKALSINRFDSLAVALYYPALYASGDIERLKHDCVHWLDANTPNPSFYMMFLIFSTLTETMQTLTSFVQENMNNEVAYLGTNFEAFFDYELIKKYAGKYAKDNELHNMVLLGDVMLLFTKGAFNSKNHTYKDGFEYSPEESQRVMNLQDEITEAFAQKKLNDYSAYMALGNTYLMQNKYEEAIFYFNKGIEDFPTRKLCGNFAPCDCYAGLNAVYWITRDTTKLIKNIENKIGHLGNEYMSSDDYLLLAQCYYLKGDLKTAEEYTVQAINKDPKNCEALRLRSHLFFLLGNNSMISDYLEQASAVLTSKYEAANFLLQCVIYDIYFGDLQTASNRLSQARAIRGNCEWELSDILEREFLMNK